MLNPKYIILSLIFYFLSLYLFFTSQFVSYAQIDGYSTKSVIGDQAVQSFKRENLIKKNIPSHSVKDNKKYNSNKNTQIKDLPEVKQVIFIIIDALRYDYLNRIKFFTETIQTHPSTTLIKKSIVGVPTMTTQRIQSMMTGSDIFTSANILQMFLSTKSRSDNIIDQLLRHNKTVKIFGDDTWTKLFTVPKQNAFVCDSTFNIRDYYTCDNIVYENLQKHIVRNATQQTKTSLLIAHFLSIDHIGHLTSSITSPEIQKHLDKMSIYFQYLLKEALNDTMIIITGDHGMRDDGNHGGGTKIQKQTLFFAHYKGNPSQQIKELNFKQRIKQFDSGYVHQVDIAVTLSILLNIPVPINSIGYPIMQILPNKYTNYLQRIQFNVLQGYKRIIKFYKFEQQFDNKIYQQQSKSDNSQFRNQINHRQDQSCISKIQRIQQSILVNIQQSQATKFQQLIQRKQYIKKQIQQSKCLSQTLTLVKPNKLIVISSLIVMGLSFIVFVGLIFVDDCKRILKNKLSVKYQNKTRNNQDNKFNNNSIYNSKNIMNENLKKSNNNFISSFIKFIVNINSQVKTLMLQHLGWILSIFSIYFSWYLIKNSSTWICLLIITCIVLFPVNKLKTIQKLSIICLILLITQFQVQKVNEYELNILNLQVGTYIINLLKSLKLYTQQSNRTSSDDQKYQNIQNFGIWFNIICISIWFLINIKQRIRKVSNRNRKKHTFKHLKMSRTATNNENSNQINNNQNVKNNYPIQIIDILLLVVVYLNLLLPFSEQLGNKNIDTKKNTIFSNIKNKIQQTQSNKQQVTNEDNIKLRYIFNFIILGLILMKVILSYRKANSKKTYQQTQSITLISFFSILFGTQHFLILLLFLKVLNSLLNKQQQQQNFEQIKALNKSINNVNNKNNIINISTGQYYHVYVPNEGKIVLVCLISEYIWWILGNRYEYSSIDIKKSYILTSQFNIVLNTIGMTLWFMCPFLISLWLVHENIKRSHNSIINNIKSQQKKQPHNKLQKQNRNTILQCQLKENNLSQQDQQQKNVSTNNNDLDEQQINYLLQNKTNINIISIQNNTDIVKINQKTILTQYNQLFMLQINHYLKYLFIPLSGLFSACLNVYYNNEKILFTVVYVPLVVFSIIKTVTILIVIILFVLRKYRINLQ